MARIPMKERLYEFIGQFANDECAREVLQLLGRHPCARLNRLAIMHAADWRKPDIDRALRTLADRRLINSSVDKGITLYCLTEAEPQNSLTR